MRERERKVRFIAFILNPPHYGESERQEILRLRLRIMFVSDIRETEDEKAKGTGGGGNFRKRDRLKC